MGTFSFMDGYVRYFENLETYLSPEYLKSSLTTAIIIGILGAALIIFASIMTKKGLVLGIITGIMQIVGSFSAQKIAHLTLSIDFYRVETIYGSSQAEINQKTEQFYKTFFNDAMSNIVPLCIFSMLYMVSWILTLIFIVKALENRPKVFPAFALVFQIVRYAFVAPYNAFAPALGPMTEAAQKSHDVRYYLITLLPLVLLAVGALLTFFKNKKQNSVTDAPVEVVESVEPVAVAAEEAPAEAAAEEAVEVSAE